MNRCHIDQLLSDKSIFDSFKNDMEAGAVAIIPTDTLYGFAVSAKQSEAVKRIYNIKHRDTKKPLILFIPEVLVLKSLGFGILPKTLQKIERHWPGALTAIFDTPYNEYLKAFSFPKIGVRIPKHKKLLEVLHRLPTFLLTTSANRSGNIECQDPEMLTKEFANEVDWLIEDGILPQVLSSTVADFTITPPLIIRQGSIEIDIS